MNVGDNASAPDRSEFTLSEWRCALVIIASFGAGLALLGAGSFAHEDVTTAVGVALLLLPFPLSWFDAAIEIRAGRAESGESWTRRKWISKWVRVPITGAVAAAAWWVFGCSGGAFAGLALGLISALLDPVAHSVAVAAHRLLDRPPGFIPEPTVRIEGPKRVFKWIAATISAASAGVALGIVAGLTMRPGVLTASVVALGLSVLANWRRRYVTDSLGAPRRFVK
jgi:hypothetical protein